LRYFPREVFHRTLELLGTSPEFWDAHPEEFEKRAAEALRDDVPRGAVARQLRCIGCSQIARESFRISAPTLVIAGEHDGVIPSCYGRQMAADIPSSRFELAIGCGHNPLMEQPEGVVPMIVDFLHPPRMDRRMREWETASFFMEDSYRA
jgi:pimeloyl-ACP methyl ester carboxylesterase